MKKWTFPELPPESFSGGDMPGDKIEIGPSHIKRAEVIIPELQKWLNKNAKEKVVISVYGGSGVGKSEIGSLLTYYCRANGIPAYLLSGDNYPYRIPEDNDKERLRIYRHGVLDALASSEDFSSDDMESLKKIWQDNNPFPSDDNKWQKCRQAGADALYQYLGTEKEIDFTLLNRIIRQFKAGEKNIPLKRMGRQFDDIERQPVDFSSTQILIIEWTHGNNPRLDGVDFPVFLYSTPEETLAHRLSRARDKGADSPFVSLVLSIEQKKLTEQAPKAALIVSLSGEIINFDEFERRQVNE